MSNMAWRDPAVGMVNKKKQSISWREESKELVKEESKLETVEKCEGG